MPHPRRPFDPRALSPSQRDALIDDLYDVHRRIFAGVERAAFRAYILNPQAMRSRLQLFYSEEGAVIGYASFRLFPVTLSGRRATVLRAAAGILPEHRGQTLMWPLFVGEVFRLMLRHPLKQHVFVASPVHPASYYALARTTPHMHPRPDETPPESARLLEQLDAQLDMVRPPGTGPHVRAVGWITRQSASEAAYWRAHDSELVQFYLRKNPDYGRGDGLRVACPLSARTFAVGLKGLLRTLLRRRLEQLSTPLRQQRRGR